ncbi:hypothetical protein LSH36_621g01011 [Paralvinella palmiformis]|uniref:Uncharacterized protein n=1 Tax=Paralvinella palmiformis TaxID=53620 RepID=A0AAD9MX59_9ANNE|nr:hypothetical protein LSH36_621g01011 [Paralvinella palmiformis]
MRENRDVFTAQLIGKNVVITGASSGIGEQLAYQYVGYGANVFITARRKRRLQEVIEKCKSYGNSQQKCGFLTADMGKIDDRERVIKAAIEFFGDIDQLILNHASQPLVYKWSGRREQLEHLDVMLNVNMVSFVHLTAAALSSLRRTSGSICVVGSGSGRIPTPFTLEYAASKFALDGFFSGLRYEFKANKENISITHCVLGFISTESGSRSFQKVTALMGSPNTFLLSLLQPAKLEDAVQAIISATTSRLGEIYFPSSQMVWLMSVIRSLFPEIEKFDLAGFTKS